MITQIKDWDQGCNCTHPKPPGTKGWAPELTCPDILITWNEHNAYVHCTAQCPHHKDHRKDDTVGVVDNDTYTYFVVYQIGSGAVFNTVLTRCPKIKSHHEITPMEYIIADNENLSGRVTILNFKQL